MEQNTDEPEYEYPVDGPLLIFPDGTVVNLHCVSMIKHVNIERSISTRDQTTVPISFDVVVYKDIFKFEKLIYSKELNRSDLHEKIENFKRLRKSIIEDWKTILQSKKQ